MSRLALRQPPSRLAFIAPLLLLPLTSVWNIAVGPKHEITVGPKLGGVTREEPIVLSWSSIWDGSFQKAVASRVAEAFVFRPLLIRVNNEIRAELFGDLTAPHVVRGAKGHLLGRLYLDEYCARTEGMGAKFAADIIPKLTAIQHYYRQSGGVFVYLISPSKAAHLPEYFLDRFNCPSSQAARLQLVPQYVSALRAAGINVVDAASLIHSKKGAYEVTLFSEGGEHWNDLGGALAVSAIVEEINRQAGHELVPPFTFAYTLTSAKSRADRELVDLLNVFFPPLGYLTPKLSFDQPASCANHGAHELDVAVVGSSFGFLPSQMMLEHNCLSRLTFYYYALVGLFGGQPFHELKRSLSEEDFHRVHDAKVMIVEENESFVARTSYVDRLLAVVSK
jgi:alginate O-acetyltransferase complex protein AlgJ